MVLRKDSVIYTYRQSLRKYCFLCNLILIWGYFLLLLKESSINFEKFERQKISHCFNLHFFE